MWHDVRIHDSPDIFGVLTRAVFGEKRGSFHVGDGDQLVLSCSKNLRFEVRPIGDVSVFGAPDRNRERSFSIQFR